MPDWRRIVSATLVVIPAAIVTAWYRVYVVLIALASLVTVGILAIVLVLWTFGIRWGW